MEDGADLLDLGGESSRPGSEPVSLSEELRRIVPAVEALSDRLDVPISIDTTKAEVARRPSRPAPASSTTSPRLSGDPDMGRVAAESGAGVVLMHMQGVPSTMQEDPRYADVVREVYDFLARRADWAESIGIPRDRIAIDPGIGFGKTIEHNLEILRNLRRFDTLGCAVVIGTSRKGFLGKITGRALPARATASVVSSLAACVRGRPGREGPRRRTDGRCDQGLGGGAGLEEDIMSASTSLVAESAEGVEPCTIITFEPLSGPGPAGEAGLAEAGGRRRCRQGRLAEAIGRRPGRAPRGDPLGQ